MMGRCDVLQSCARVTKIYVMLPIITFAMGCLVLSTASGYVGDKLIHFCAKMN